MSINPIGTGSIGSSAIPLPHHPLPPGLDRVMGSGGDNLVNLLARAAQNQPEVTNRDPKTKSILDQLRALKHKARRSRSKGATQAQRQTMARALNDRLQSLLEKLRTRLQQVQPRQQEAVAQAAQERYGESVGDQIRALLDSDMPFDQLLMMVGAILNDHYEEKVRETMGKIAQNNDGKSATGADGAEKTSKNKKKSRRRALAFKIAKAVVGTVGAVATVVASIYGTPAAGAAVATGTGMAMKALDSESKKGTGATSSTSSEAQKADGTGETSAEDKKMKDNQLQAELQYFTQKMKQAMEMVSTLLRLSHDCNMAAINQLKRL